MAIKVVCEACFQEYSLKDALAGKTVRCKNCGQSIFVPGSAPAAVRQQPAVRQKPARTAPSRPRPDEDAFDIPDEYSQPDADFPPRRPTGAGRPAKSIKKNRRKSALSSFRLKLPDAVTEYGVYWVLAVLYSVGLVVSVIVPGAAAVCVIISLLLFCSIILLGGLKLIRVMIDESVICLLFSMFVPFYKYYYMISRWDRCAGPVGTTLFGLVLGCGSLFLFKWTEDFNQRAVFAAQFARESDSAPAGSAGALFPLSSVPGAPFPDLGLPTTLPGTDISVYELAMNGGGGPGQRMRMRLYLPPGTHAAGSLGCVLVGPAGTILLTGSNLDDGSYHDETLPYARAGYAALSFSLDGDLGIDTRSATNAHVAAAYRPFRDACAGLVNARNALEFVLAKVPQVSARRIFIAGHSSAGTLSLLFAEHEPRLAGCIAYAPCSDVERRLRDFPRFLPELDDFLKRSSPRTHVERFRCPVFLFHAADDSNVPLSDSVAFANQLRLLHKQVEFAQVPTGNHYQSMINQGIPMAIRWMQSR